MNYNTLRYFSVLAQTENYTKAAARLGISQPSLSSAIHNLENSLGGIELFEKVGRNIRLTKEGRFYREKVDSALSQLHEAAAILKNSRDSAPVVIRMGFVSGTLDGIIAERMAEYSQKNSRVRFHLTEHSAEVLMDLLRQEQLDMAIVDCTDRDRTLHFRKLRERGFYVALPESHPLAESESLDPRDVVMLPQIAINYNVSNSFGNWASGHATDEQVLCTVNTVQAALDLVKANIGISVIPDECTIPREGIRYVPLTNWHQALYMCILYDRWIEPVIWEFCELAIRSVRNAEANKEINE